MNYKKLPLQSLKKNAKENKQKILFVFILLLASIIPVLILFKPGFPVTDDGTWLIIRFSAFFETLRSGQFPVRFIYRLNEGMGYPVADFLYPLYMYLATPLHILGFSFLNSIKILLTANILLTSIFSFLWLNKKFDNLSSSLGALIVVFSPYFLFDLFKRGSFGEILAFSIFPFILWQIERRSVPLTSIGIFLLLLSHNTSSIFLLSLIVIYAYLTKKSLRELLISLFFGIGMAAFFWIPALYDLRYTNFNKTQISEFYNYLFGIKDYYLIGIPTLIILASSFYFLIKQKVYKKDFFLLFSFLFSGVIIFLQLPASKVFWEYFPFKNFIQFPFRTLIVFIFLISYQGSFTASMFSKNKKYIYVGIISALVFIQSLLYLNSIKFENFSNDFYSTNQSTTTVANEYLTKWFNEDSLGDKSQKIIILSGKGRIENMNLSPNLKGFKITNSTPVVVQVNILYFPGWEVKVNNNVHKIDFQENGLIRFKLDQGEQNVRFYFKETKLRLISDIISIFSLALFIIFIFNKRIKLK